MTDESPILVTVVGGYLGAGKTTLVNHVLRSADERIAVIVNDFGDVNIDAELIESRNGDTISLTNGCICCSVVDGFAVALDSIRSSLPRPERLVIEASGVGIPSQVAAHAYGPHTELDGVVTLVDVETIRRHARSEYVGDVVAQQLASTDLVVLNKVDLIDEVGVDAVRRWLRSVTDAPTVSASHGVVDLSILVGLEPRLRGEASASPDTPGFETWTQTWDEAIDRREFDALLASLPDQVVRAKGIVRFDDAPEVEAIVQVVGRRVAITPGSTWSRPRSELVVIATTGA